ncbi:MAG: M24 family metallopeptidase [Dehalococcoidia bacterium]|nr:M24 family metallopeptidase [Dehalococcoidia bacterium]
MTAATAPGTSRLERVRTRLEAIGLDAFVVTAPSNRRWVAGFTGSAGVVFVGKSVARIASDSRYWEQIGIQSPAFELVRTRGALASWVQALLAGTGGQRVGFEPAALTYAEYEEWTQALGDLPPGDRPRLVPAPQAIEALRMVKEPEELAALERAVLLGDAACEHAIEVIEPGMTEQALAWEIQRYAIEHGADSLSFDTIIAGGPWGALPHARPRPIPLEAGQGVVLDLGVKVGGYCSDLTRTLFLGEPDAKFREIYDIVLTAQTMAEERIEAGMPGKLGHEIAHEVIRRAGYGDAFGHGLGHGVGLDIHEAPRLAPLYDGPIEEGHVVTVEPGIYLPGWGGVRIEDQCVMENGRLRVISTARKLDVTKSVRAGVQ